MDNNTQQDKEQLTDVSKLSISDVLKMKLFYDNANSEIRKTIASREEVAKRLRPGERLNAHPIDKLNNKGFLNTSNFIVTFARVLNKVETTLSSTERGFILSIGMQAFNKTMRKLINDEKERNNRNGDNKQ